MQPGGNSRDAFCSSVQMCTEGVCGSRAAKGWAVPLGVYVNSNPSVPRLVILELGGVCTLGARNLGWRGNLRILPPTI